MVEKEERIYISGYSETNPCDVCDDLSGEECDYCEKNREWNASITRQEAIERIIKGIENSGEVDGNDEIQWVGGWKKVIAEAVLNALLED